MTDRAHGAGRGWLLGLSLTAGLLLSLAMFWQMSPVDRSAAGRSPVAACSEPPCPASEEPPEAGLLPTPSLVHLARDGRLVWQWERLPLQVLRSAAALALALLAVALVFVPLESLAAAMPSRPRHRPAVVTDTIFWFFTPVVTKPISKASTVVIPALIGAGVGLPLVQWADGLQGFWARQPLWLSFAAMLVISDLAGYWTHRLFHTRWLWRLHAPHHSSEQVTWLSSVRVHPLNDLVMRLCRVTPLLALGFPLPAVALLVSLLSLASLVVHANVRWRLGPLRYVLVTPTYHRWHHTCEDEAVDKNFADLFPLCDLLFGTFYLPKATAPSRFGLRGAKVPDDFLGQLAYPFVRRDEPRGRKVPAL
jgi:sterol desaturase/sphingolipid hydroxylase (fatty acid hydroxylase superfamily)